MSKINYKEFCNNKGDFKVMEHQEETSEHIASSDVRGFLIYHGIGSGKTYTALMAIDKITKRFADFKRIYCISPNVINKNFISEMEKFGYNFKIRTIDYTEKKAKIPESFENAIIIFDEVHIFNNELLAYNLVAKEIFNKIKSTKMIKIISISGTPIYNTPFDASILINLLTIDDEFPRSGDEFEKLYINTFSYRIYRAGQFREKFRGKVSYFEGFRGTELIPTDLGLSILSHPMTDVHTKMYNASRDKSRAIIALSAEIPGKFATLYDEIKKINKESGKIFIYCQYREINELLAKYLTSLRFSSFIVANKENVDEAIDDFNNSDTKILIGDESLSTGVTLLNTRYCFMLDVPEKYGKLQQIIGRIMRLCSHSGLSEKNRNVKFYLVFSTLFDSNTSDDFKNFDAIRLYHKINNDALSYIQEAADLV